MDLGTLSNLQTEGVNPRTANIDRISTLEMCEVINADDHKVSESVKPCLPIIANAIDELAPRVRQGGRVIYVGAGTSGRLGILDASEIPPTFAASREQFIGLIAGGDAAIRQAQEGAEDNESAGEEDMKKLTLNHELDSIIGIASSGRTPYVLGCIAFGKRLGCLTIGVVCAEPSAMGLSGNVDYLIAPVPGPEVVTGSTRLKAGTATKLVLNMLSTGTMIRTGKTYGNMMVDLQASNLKLKQRSKNILKRLSSKCAIMTDSDLDALLFKCDHSVKLAILVAETGKAVEECKSDLASHGGILSFALQGNIKRGELVSNDFLRKFVLCIDGGGTKCAAVVADASGKISHGYAGSCNLTDDIANVDRVVRTLTTATKNALKKVLPEQEIELAESNWGVYLRNVFHSVRIGLAGLDRAGLHSSLAPKLSNIFDLDSASRAFKLTNDVDLIPAVIPRDSNHPPVIVLIAGTGSVAMRYTWSEDQGYVRVARSGGWGHILGDEGGGYSIGLEAIRHTLSMLEERALGLNPHNMHELEIAVTEKLGGSTAENGNADILTELLSRQEAQSIKTRIAGIAETVLRLAPSNDTAKAIVDDQVTRLVTKTLGRLVNHQCDSFSPVEESELVLTGGLSKNDLYQASLRRELDHWGLRFQAIRFVEDVAEATARCLVLQ
ncbi:hypothetical protein N7450_003689 [Penicillium hetheringtonii]|uniref:N-acetyl-D-glucosamine kinase n=1 Tax=Penicillium hetheringtonii TaxID=911720 RepID=A0AAD6DNL7_9EURO|nr:hypothetical protein N7450_003689 [Penicillium hetheringtonii]